MVEKEGENEAIVRNLIINNREISRTYPLAWDRVSAVVRIVESLVEGQRHDTRWLSQRHRRCRMPTN